MQFLAPEALLLSLLALPVILLYVLRVRLRWRTVPTLMFWREAYEERRLTAWWKRLRHLLSLLLQLFFLSLLVLALARPLPPWEERQRREWVFVIDNSASMAAREPSGENRLALAREYALNLLARLADDDPAAVVTTAPTPLTLCGPMTHRSTIRTAIQSVTETDAPDRLLDAVKLAERIARDRSRLQIVVFTDGCSETADQVREIDKVVVLPVGRRANNAGIVRFVPRRSTVDPRTVPVLIEVRNYTDRPLERRLFLDFNNAPLDVLPLSLPPRERWSETREYLIDEGGLMVAELQGSDALAADNRAGAVLVAPPEPTVFLVTTGNLFLESVFEAIPGTRLIVGRALPRNLPAEAIVVFDGNVPANLPLAPTIVIAPQGNTEYWEVQGHVEDPVVARVERGHPLTANVRLDDVLFVEAKQLRFRRPCIPLATNLRGDPLYALVERTGGDILILTCDIEKCDLPLRTAFPIMMANAVGWFFRGASAPASVVATGEIASLPIASNKETTIRAVGPGQQFLGAVRDRFGNVRFGPLPRIGLWHVQTEDSEGQVLGRVYAALQSEAEGDLYATWKDPVRKHELGLSWIPARSTWFYLVLGAFLLSSLEWWLYQRRWIS